MSQPVFIAGSALASALTDPQQLTSAVISQVAIDTLQQPLDIPFMAIAGQRLFNNPDRMQIVTDQVMRAAIADAGWDKQQLDQCAVFIGSTSFSLYDTELIYQQTLCTKQNETAPLTVTSYTMLPDYIQQHFTPKARFFTFNTACTSSANALLYASKMINNGTLRHAIVLGMEFFNQTTLLGFHALGLISKSRQMQPFGLGRDGLCLGEACSAVLLSADKPTHAPAFRIAGGATLGDTFSMTAANPDGSSIEKVIRQALHHAAIPADQISAIKLHGTASLANDDVEHRGLARVFPHPLPPACVLKPAIGHTLGACGSNELILLMNSLKHGLLPGLATPYTLDPDLPVGLDTRPRSMPAGNFLLNYFGFGGNNTALILSNLP